MTQFTKLEIMDDVNREIIQMTSQKFEFYKMKELMAADTPSLPFTSPYPLNQLQITQH